MRQRNEAGAVGAWALEYLKKREIKVRVTQLRTITTDMQVSPIDFITSIYQKCGCPGITMIGAAHPGKSGKELWDDGIENIRSHRPALHLRPNSPHHSSIIIPKVWVCFPAGNPQPFA